MPQQNYNTKSKDAASVKKRVYQVAKDEINKVESGKSLRCKVDIFPESRFPNWATMFASMICTSPELANLNNEQLASLIENEKGETGLDYTILSKKLGAVQLQLVREILRKHGYATDTLVKGTDIKRIVKNQIRSETEKDEATKFYHDSIEIDGTMYLYKLRRNLSGNRVSDLCIRMLGSDVPLIVVLKLRGISVNEFTTKDERAREFAAQQHTVDLSNSKEKPKHNKSLEQLIERTSNREREVDPNNYTGTQIFEMMRAWYLSFSPARQKMATFSDFWNQMKSNPTFVNALHEYVDTSEESDQDADKINVTAGLSNGEYISDVNGNLIDISNLRSANSFTAYHEARLPEFAETTLMAAHDECLTY